MALFMVFFCYVNFILVDYFIWWSVFVISTFIFVIYLKSYVDVYCLVNYYLIQELCGYFFLIFSNFYCQILLLMVKAGVAPFHFWLFSVTSRLISWFLMWFLVLQKMPYFPVIFNFCGMELFFIIFLGLFFCYLNNFFCRDASNMLVIFSTESFNWLLLFSLFSFGSVYFFFLYYYFIMIFIIPFFSSFYNCMSWELILLFFNIPLGLTFFLKIMVLFYGAALSGIYMLLVLFLMLMFSVSVIYWILMSSMYFSYGLKNINFYFFFFLPSMFLLFF
uniref:NADH dehydrogenase subunit 2 n=1 Tax=Crassicauda sp. Ningbo-2019 TaxID=2860933 RepID=A0A8F6U4Z4_9BILA|nr:NADH dehydrogenase subunit 2 [Crassicauda sp. Ningbo-2019]WHL46730.1 NADH dehydrogenase subunit 2 [Crassicauda magna]